MRVSPSATPPLFSLFVIVAGFCTPPVHCQANDPSVRIQRTDAPSEREKFNLERKKLFWGIFGAGLTVASVSLGGIGLGVSWDKDRKLRRRQYADQIRASAGQTIAKLERWSAISGNFFSEIQPAITDADIQLVTTKDVIATRDQLWRSLLETLTARSRTILDEQIELAYVDLYGYDPGVRALFRIALQNLKLADEQSGLELLARTQADVLSFSHHGEKSIPSAALGNRLRATADEMRNKAKTAMDVTIVPFQRELARLIDAPDSIIAGKGLRLQSPEQVFQTGSSSPSTY